MKLSRTKIAKLLKSKNQSRKSLRSKSMRSKSLGHKGFRTEELVTTDVMDSTNVVGTNGVGTNGVAKPKSLHNVKKRQRTANAHKKPINLRLKTMKWHKAGHKVTKGGRNAIDAFKKKPDMTFDEFKNLLDNEYPNRDSPSDESTEITKLY
jgi:hypothetical protein